MRKPQHKLVAEAIRELLCGRVTTARSVLDKPRIPDDETVHTARKELKGARAGLRLLRGVAGEDRYVYENARLRDAARPLSRVRDAKVLIDTAQELLKGARGQRVRNMLIDLVRTLRRERKELRDATSGQNLRPVLAALREAETTLASQPFDSSDNSLKKDVTRLYCKSRKALRAARDDRSDDSLHEARKQAKYLMNGLLVLEAIGARRVEARIECAKAIGDALGSDHDLALIQARISKLPASQQRASATLSENLHTRREELQREAFRHGKRLYAQKPRAFVKSIGIT
ncbi:MAG TPA: CHAD domain-containing protein [Burkholderiales bacterium]|jgi:CHAD domain-containing protein|nr:CHAD domain-containing protein [Burkholderiales bacterium]